MSLLIGEFFSISSKGDVVAFCNSDGVIKLYDTLTGAIKLEYASSAHLKGVCTCLQWFGNDGGENSVNDDGTASQKKIKTSTAQAKSSRNQLRDLNLIVLGTSEGSILVYDISKASIFTIMQDDSVAAKINDLTCSSSNDNIYACTDDGSILEWSFSDSKLICKWKASKTALTAIIVKPKSNYLLSASKTIAIWDLGTKTKIKTLTGHSSDIFRLLSLNKSIISKKPDEMTNDYFVSVALNDRIINTWMLPSSNELENSATTPVFSFSAADSPIYIDVVNLNIANYNRVVAILVVVTNRGHLYLYLNELATAEKSGKSAKKSPFTSNFKPFKQLSIETKENVTLKINAAFLCNSNTSERTNLIELDSKTNHGDLSDSVFNQIKTKFGLFVAYGASENLRIEKLNFNELIENKTRLVREDPSKVSISTQVENSKIENSIVHKDLQVLVPGMVGPESGAMMAKTGQKRKSNETNQMTLEDKLEVMGINSVENSNGDTFNRGNLPKADNLLVLLVQGLQSNDSKTLNHVLQHKNEKVINKTVSLLSSQFVISLVKELTQRLQGHAQSGLGMIKWLKAILMIHTSFLMSYPEIVDSLSKLYESMNSRTKLFPQLSKLQGKLQLAISQISSQADRLNLDGIGDEKDREEFLYYQESTSEDEQIEDDLIPSHGEELEADEFLFSDEEEDSTQDEIGIS